MIKEEIERYENGVISFLHKMRNIYKIGQDIDPRTELREFLNENENFTKNDDAHIFTFMSMAIDLGYFKKSNKIRGIQYYQLEDKGQQIINKAKSFY